MIEIGRENQFYGFAHEGMQACCTARDGDVLRFHTQDCYGDLLTREDIRRAAEKKCQEINEAKERIYKARGM